MSGNIVKTDFNVTQLEDPLVDHKHKVIFVFSAAAGCSTVTAIFLQHLGLYDEAKDYSKWVHDYRTKVFMLTEEQLQEYDINEYYVVKFVRNPYDRVVSSYIKHYYPVEAEKTDTSFYGFLKSIIDGRVSNHTTLGHSSPLHLSKVDKIDVVIQIEHMEEGLAQLDAKMGTKFLQSHREVFGGAKHKALNKRDKSDDDVFFGETQLCNLPGHRPRGDCFYDNKIKIMVERIYGKDIDMYGYQFPYGPKESFANKDILGIIELVRYNLRVMEFGGALLQHLSDTIRHLIAHSFQQYGSLLNLSAVIQGRKHLIAPDREVTANSQWHSSYGSICLPMLPGYDDIINEIVNYIGSDVELRYATTDPRESNVVTITISAINPNTGKFGSMILHPDVSSKRTQNTDLINALNAMKHQLHVDSVRVSDMGKDLSMLLMRFACVVKLIDSWMYRTISTEYSGDLLIMGDPARPRPALTG